MVDRTLKLEPYLEEAQRLGAAAAELLVERSSGFDVVVRRGRVISQLPYERSRVVGRVWLEGGRVGSDTGVLLEDLPDVFARAIAQAESAPEDPHAGPVADVRVRTRGLGIYDRRYSQLDPSDRTEILVAAERGARDVDRRVSTGEFRSHDAVRRRQYASTRGVSLEELSTSYHAQGSVQAESEEGPLDFGCEARGRTFASIGCIPFGTVVAERMVDLLRDGPRPTGPTRVMLTPQVVAPLFSRIAEVFAWRDPRESFLGQVPEGEAVAARKVHMVDDGSLPGAQWTRSFDDRGAPPVTITLLREGVPVQTYLDVEAARARRLSPTGHFRDGKLRPSNIALRQGTRSMNALLSQHDDVDTFMVMQLEGVEQVDLVTGQLRGRAHGIIRRGKEDLGAVRHVGLEGNLVEALPQLVDIASDTDRIGNVDAPGMLLDGFLVID